MTGGVCVSAGDLLSSRIRKNSVKVQECVIRRNEKVSIEGNRGRRMKGIRGAYSTRLQIELLELQSNRCGGEIEDGDVKLLYDDLDLGRYRSRRGNQQRIGTRNALRGLHQLTIESFFHFVIRQT
jgi:hypothetical protein